MAKKPKPYAYTQYTPTDYQGGDLTYTPIDYNQSPEYKQAIDKYGQMLGTPQQENPYMTGTLSEYNRIMSPDYQAYSTEDINRLYGQGKEQLSKDFFAQNRQKAARDAATGMTGSGTAGVTWDNLSGNQDKALTDFYQNLLNQNMEATRQNKSNAFSMGPQMASLQNQIALQPLQNQAQWLSLLGGENAAQNQVNQFNAGQANQVAANNWNRKYDVWNAKNQFGLANNQGINQANQMNYENAYQAYLRKLKEQQENNPWNNIGKVAGEFLPFMLA